jgi:hypothetical protein
MHAKISSDSPKHDGYLMGHERLTIIGMRARVRLSDWVRVGNPDLMLGMDDPPRAVLEPFVNAGTSSSRTDSEFLCWC